MASTTKTVNLELSQFVGTDKPAWLTDYNGDMQKIDDGYKKLEDANTATQADLDATKQNLDGSKSDISNLEAEVQALTAADVALQTRTTVLEANYDTMHHEVAVNAQDIAEMKPYAMISSNKKSQLHVSEMASVLDASCDGIYSSFGITDLTNDVMMNILFGKFFNSVSNNIKECSLMVDNRKPSDNYSITNSTNIVFPAGGLHFEYLSDERVAIHIKTDGGRKFLTIAFDKTAGITFSLNDNGSVTQLFNIPVPVTSGP